MPFKKTPPFYFVWASMLDRCRNPNSRAYPDYGGRGIRVCERWKSYKNFAADMGPRPKGKSLDRIDNDGDYEPGNCRWATKKEQQRNQRRAVYVLIEGIQYRAIDLSERYGLKTDTIVARAAKGMTFADVTTQERHVFTEGLALGGKASGRKKQSRTHCGKGHEYSVENTLLTKEGWRYCRTCHNAKMRARNRLKREAA